MEPNADDAVLGTSPVSPGRVVATSTSLLERTVSLNAPPGKPARTLKVTFAPGAAPGSSPPSTETLTAVSKVWQRKILQDLQDETHFSATELQVLLSHFQEVVSEDRLDRDTFFSRLGNAFGTSERSMLLHIYNAMDETNRGFVSFRQFVCALSTMFRGDKDDVLDFWFRMYDSDKDGLLTRKEFEEVLKDINTASRKAIEVQVEEVFETGGSDADAVNGDTIASEDGDARPDGHISYEEFRIIMEEHDIIPMFVNPHKFAQHKQLPAFRTMSPAEREVVLLLGTEMRPAQGEVLITENEKCTYFYFIVDGDVALERGGITLGTLHEGHFLGESALFLDVKAQEADGSVTFTTAASVRSESGAHVLKLNIQDFYPLVYHEHPGATAIVQRLGRIMLERFQQTEERLQAILAAAPRQAEAGMRLSSKDWTAFRNRLTKQWALKYHKIGRKGKLEVVPTKQMGTREDLSVAYSPGVAEPCLSIQQNERWAFEYTAKGHLVGVITNGTAVLGLGNIGPLAGKPVMEGKAVLFKKFADLDAFDIEVAAEEPQKLVDIVVALEPTFGGVNLEDIRAPECFYVERECQRRMNIPVFHDDQHGTAIIAGAGLLNALELVGKDIKDIRVVVCGCGAAGYTCATYFVTLGVHKANLLAVDVKGVVYAGRDDLTPDNYLSNVAVDTPLRTLKEAVAGADVFLGLSAGNLLTPEMLCTMARDPIVFACANPMPEIDPDLARATRPDVIMCTGRCDFPNQINNVCAFPYIFRGALDCRARSVNESMKLAATYAIARLAKTPPTIKKRTPSFGDLLQLPGSGDSAAGTASSTHESGDSGSSRAGGGEPAADESPTRAPPANGAAANGAAANGGGSSSPRSGVSGSGNSFSKRNSSPSRLRRKSHGELAGPEGSAASAGSQASMAELVPRFGRDYIIPKPFDERLLPEVAAAVVEAAIQTGVARLPDMDLSEYRRSLIDLAHRMNM